MDQRAEGPLAKPQSDRFWFRERLHEAKTPGNRSLANSLNQDAFGFRARIWRLRAHQCFSFFGESVSLALSRVNRKEFFRLMSFFLGSGHLTIPGNRV